ncbi:AraC family transcriptional regulator [Dyella dinghuensis]|uniref:AraC family transcriptional regulator n=1 Tax=Dyella dinghuensis TaxID=1920169 RepID=A0A3S0PYQ1_9GAMM|nr:AraC family transcriptional regulator [Dyella dinghuensis]RUL64173.1 AraC family transcriptional regulator [Dyella dinghuensis]
MDSLSHLVRTLSVSGRVDLHCLLAGIWIADQPKAPPGHVPYHVVFAGGVRVRMGHNVHEFEAGDILVFPHGAGHVLESIAQDANHTPSDDNLQQHFNGVVTELIHPGEGPALEMLCGEFVLGETGIWLLRALPDVLRISAKDRPSVLSLVGMMRDESVEPKPGSAAVVTELSTALFTLLLRRVMTEQVVHGSVLALLADTRISRAVDAVLQNPAQPWTVDTLAKQAHLSRATFARHFTQRSGMAPLEWVTQVRMELAARLLTHDGLAANHVAERCGYASEAAFGRVFKKHYQVGPGAYRRRTLNRSSLNDSSV